MARLFVSYSRKETSKKLIEELIAYFPDHSIFWDTGTTSMSADNWWETIQREIKRSDVFIHIISNFSKELEHSDNPKDNLPREANFPYREYEYATTLKKPIIPILTNSASVPSYLGCRNYIDFNIGYERGINILKQDIKWMISSQFSNMKEELNRQIEKRQKQLPTNLNNVQEPNPSAVTAILLAMKKKNIEVKELARRLDEELELIEAILDGTIPEIEISKEFIQEIKQAIDVEAYSIGDNYRDNMEHRGNYYRHFIEYDSMGRRYDNIEIPESREVLRISNIGNRYGLGIKNGLPEIDWVEIPGEKSINNGTIPQHKIALPTFWISRYPITYAQFQAFIDAADGFGNDQWWRELASPTSRQINQSQTPYSALYYKKVNVNWYDAIAFCRWLSYRAGGSYEMGDNQNWTIRLPIAAELKKAAYHENIYPYGDKFQSNKTGIDDFTGNVWEWTLNEYGNNTSIDLSNSSHNISSQGIDTNSTWATTHFSASPDYRQNSLGFRAVSVTNPRLIA